MTERDIPEEIYQRNKNIQAWLNQTSGSQAIQQQAIAAYHRALDEGQTEKEAQQAYINIFKNDRRRT